MKSFLRSNFPQLWSYARGAKDRVKIEYYLLRRMSLRHLLPGFSRKEGSWDMILPYQAVRRIEIPSVNYSSIDAMIADLKTAGLAFGEGTFALYLPPETVAKSAFRVLAGQYPPDAGVKIVKMPGGVGVSTYGPGLMRKYVDRHLLLAANLMYAQSVGPRIYDLVELESGGVVWTAYVMRHVEGRSPSAGECESGVAKMRDLEREGLLNTVAAGGFGGIDFQPPSCNGNALVDAEGRFVYVDFQHFVLGDYSKYLEKVAGMAAEDSHFGSRRILGGGRFLYQSIPAVKMAAKRSVESRSTLYSNLLSAAGVSVRDKVVLDVGCNIGMMIAEYLKWGARWCHGWDFPNVVPHTERLLLALGCTRFSTTGGKLTHDRRLEDDLAPWLRSSLKGCVISYLAVHGHIGWIEALSRIPWSFLIYEGHEKDTRDDVMRHLSDLGKVVDFETKAIHTSEDGASTERLAAILVRRGAAC